MPAKKQTDEPVEETAVTAEESTDKGFFGTKTQPFPNEAYSLKSGPDSPSASEVLDAIRKGDSK